jgi:predicted deacylase
MKVGTIEANPGEKAFGFLTGTETHAGFAVQLPLHVVAGAKPGPTLLVQAGVSGLEIEPAAVLPQLVRELDTAQLSGVLLVVPLLNISGFEFEQVEAVWDNKDLNALGKGNPEGSVSQVLLDRYYTEVVSRADALIDIHTGALWGYYRYAGVYDLGDTARSQALAVALGLPQVLLGQPADNSLAQAAAVDGKAVVSAWIGGGPGLRDYRADDVRRVRNAVLNALRHLGMWPGPVEPETTPIAVYRCHTTLRTSGPRGLTFMAKEKRGQQVRAGEEIGIVRHPYTGAVLHRFTAPQAGTMLHAGAVWPILPEDATLAILGDLVAEIDPAQSLDAHSSDRG